MKICTNIEQSKKLAEILPIESADMYWAIDEIPFLAFPVNDIVTDCEYAMGNGMLPAWSLAALVGVLPVMIDYKGSLIRLRMDKGNVGQDDYAIWYDDLDNGLSTNIASEAKNFIDAAYEMIIKLHELNLI